MLNRRDPIGKSAGAFVPGQGKAIYKGVAFSNL